MPRNRGGRLPDSVAAHPEAARLLVNLISNSAVKNGDSAAKWREHPKYWNIFKGICPEKFRKRFIKLLKECDYQLVTENAKNGMF